jgi:glycerol-3-phosphate acyltransferase PlsX
MLPGIDRPAIMTEIPAKTGHTHMLDLGANANCTAENLFQFAVMGSIVAADIGEVERPRIALLNIGSEDKKGHDMIREAAARLQSSSLNYVGFIEGNDLFSGKADVIVTDGFTGNVALKTAEGTIALVKNALKTAFNRNLLTKLQGLLASSVLRNLGTETDARNYNGATLIGLNGIVIKSHGDADAYAFLHAIDTAVVEVQSQVPEQIRDLLQRETA